MVITKNQATSSCHDASENHPKGELAWIFDWNIHDILLSNFVRYKFGRSEEYISITERKSKSSTGKKLFIAFCLRVVPPYSDSTTINGKADTASSCKLKSLLIFTSTREQQKIIKLFNTDIYEFFGSRCRLKGKKKRKLINLYSKLQIYFNLILIKLGMN